MSAWDRMKQIVERDDEPMQSVPDGAEPIDYGEDYGLTAEHTVRWSKEIAVPVERKAEASE